jgi:predicted transcriptional regulator
MCPDAAKSIAAERDVFFNIRLKPDMHRDLARLAKLNERTIAAEIRLAVRERLEREVAA